MARRDSVTRAVDDAVVLPYDRRPMIQVQDAIATLGAGVVATRGAHVSEFHRPMPLDAAEPGAITFCRAGHPRALEMIARTRASVVVCGVELADATPPEGKLLILVEDPRLQFLRVVQAYFADPRPTGIHPTAVIHPDAKIGDDVAIGPHCAIGRCVIGNGCTLSSNVTLHDRVTLGRNVSIQAGTVIGAPGFGYQRNEDGVWEHFPHVGGVEIHDDVEIGANTCIDRGALANTVIGRGVKIDNLVHIAHNVVVGEHSVIIGTAQVAGSVRIGDHSWIAPSATIMNGVKIGREVTIGLGSVIVSDVPDHAKTMTRPAALLPPDKK